jgi:hypothetical protein
MDAVFKLKMLETVIVRILEKNLNTFHFKPNSYDTFAE